MKQFNLQKYLAHPERKVVTRDGKDVRIICTDRKSKVLYDGPILALVDEIKEGREYCYAYSSDGKVYESESDADLFFALTKKEGWVNIIRNEVHNEAFCGKIYASKEEAENHANSATLATARIEWEEEL